MYVHEPNPIPEALPQNPKPESKFTDPFWYANQPLGVNRLSKMIKEHSLGSTLSKTYTNHRVRFRLPYAMNCMADFPFKFVSQSFYFLVSCSESVFYSFLNAWQFFLTLRVIICNQRTTILDKNVKKNACCVLNVRILPSTARFTQDTPPSPPQKTMLKCGPNIFAAY